MYKFFIKGVVQGVGFRPYIYNSCVKEGLKGYIKNIGDGVEVIVNNKEKFIIILKEIPTLARIDSYEIEVVDEVFYEDFKIIESEGEGFSEIPADLFLCEECLKELNENENRRNKYYFTTCTNCGPRFSISKKSPYDRVNTSMSEYNMCDLCKNEYENPADRRYHAQTIACIKCGPKLRLYINGNEVIDSEIKLIEKAVEKIKNGEVIAIKGVGGFHLCCLTKNESVNNLRGITRRKNKPYAIMCKNYEMALKIANINEKEKDILESPQRPIVVLDKKDKNAYYEVSELNSIGVMLPYTSLHYLIFDFIDEPLVMTSSNFPDEPITNENKEQFVEIILTHDRKIENFVDDSVIKIIEGKKLFLRRSRGFVPQSIEIKSDCKKTILALGAEMSNTFCIYKNGRAIASQYMGNTSNLKSFNNYKQNIKKFLEFTNSKPDVILCDKHPEYNTTISGEELSKELKVPLIKVQHHIAHSYSIAKEINFDDFTSIVCDGLGYGNDGNIWGGEIFLNDIRTGHLEEQYQLGGDSASKDSRKMLFSILRKILSLEEIKKYITDYTENELDILDKQLKDNFNCPLTSSCGRILDATCALLGFGFERTYEGRQAMLLESNSTIPYDDLEPVIEDNILMTTPLFEYLIKNYDRDKKRLAATVQLYLAKGLYEIAKRFDKPIVFGGGCAYNKIMTKFMLDHNVYINNNVPAGCGGISFGQIGYYLKQLTNSGNDIS